MQIERPEQKVAREKSGGRYKVPNDNEIEAYFEDIFGVSKWPKGKPEQMRVKAWGLGQHVLDTKPIHKTQTVIEDGADYKIFQWEVIPNEELVQALLVYADQMEVIEGDWLRHKLKERAEKILENLKKVSDE